MNRNKTKAERISASKKNNGFGVPAISYSDEYATWQNIKARCYNKNHPRFMDWGGRGIFVCDDWRSSFDRFYSDMGPRPSKSHSIDRVDSNGPYSPENCRWATNHQQATNRPGWVRNLTFNGKTQTITQWSVEIGLARKSLSDRLALGWSIEEALTIPKGGKRGK